MALTMNDLTVNFSHVDRASLLSDWHWLIGEHRLPILISAAGDAFLEDAEDGAIAFLDTGANELLHICESVDTFKKRLTEAPFVSDYFAAQMIGDLQAADVQLGPGQLYSLKKPVALGGEYRLDNIEPCDIEVHFSMAGQLAEKINDLPPGTKIGNVSLS